MNFLRSERFGLIGMALVFGFIAYALGQFVWLPAAYLLCGAVWFLLTSVFRSKRAADDSGQPIFVTPEATLAFALLVFGAAIMLGRFGYFELVVVIAFLVLGLVEADRRARARTSFPKGDEDESLLATQIRRLEKLDKAMCGRYALALRTLLPEALQSSAHDYESRTLERWTSPIGPVYLPHASNFLNTFAVEVAAERAERFIAEVERCEPEAVARLTKWLRDYHSQRFAQEVNQLVRGAGECAHPS